MKSPTPSHSKLSHSKSVPPNESQTSSAITDTHAPAVPSPATGVEDSEVTVLTPASSITPEQYPSGITSRELAHALQGETLGHFLLQEFIGGGGMGVVFKAYDTRLDRTVAVKVVASQRVSTEELERRFKVEAQSAARLDHPNIARVYEVDKARGLPYIVFEYIEGSNLRDLVAQKGILSVNDALHYTYQLAHALAHATDRDVVHRDIKPSNILITPEGQTKLVDMGLARLKQLGTEENDLTATGMTLGTFDYISPEQARDPRTADARSDIYSLGCTLFYMLAGRAPFADGTMVEKLMLHQSETPPDLRQFRHDIPDAVSVLVRTMLAKNPAERQQHPAQVAQQIRAILQELGSTVTHPLGPVVWNSTPEVSPFRHHLPWLIPLGALLLAIALLNGSQQPITTEPPFAPLQVTKQQDLENATKASENQKPVENSEASTTATPEMTRSEALPVASEETLVNDEPLADRSLPVSDENTEAFQLEFDPSTVTIVEETNPSSEEAISPLSTGDSPSTLGESTEGEEVLKLQFVE